MGKRWCHLFGFPGILHLLKEKKWLHQSQSQQSLMIDWNVNGASQANEANRKISMEAKENPTFYEQMWRKNDMNANCLVKNNAIFYRFPGIARNCSNTRTRSYFGVQIFDEVRRNLPRWIPCNVLGNDVLFQLSRAIKTITRKSTNLHKSTAFN